METLFEVAGSDVLQAWAGQRRQRRCSAAVSPSAGVRFAFYGRTSTEGFQDPVTSRAWQREVAESVIAGHGVIAVEFVDVGWSREVMWERRPAAAALLAAARSPEREFDAVVVGEFERGFSARQFLRVAEKLERCGVRVWLPEADGPVDPGDPAHRALVTLLGAQAKREVVRARHRTVAAMQSQTVEQGRFLGGRPPYGYRLVDAGPHPNRVQAGWGRRLQRLDPDPVTAGHVRWMFARRLAGCSLAGIARELNERGVPCPSVSDVVRHRNRVGGLWSVPTVGVILANPRYTGREVWNRRQAVGGTTRSTVVGECVVSKSVSHPELVSEADFVAVQRVRAARPTGDGGRRRYLLGGLVRCGLCGRRMDSHWVHGRAGYRCRHGFDSAKSRPLDAHRNVYVREDVLLGELVARLVSEQDAVDLDARPLEAVDYLRLNALVVVCSPDGWRLATRD